MKFTTACLIALLFAFIIQPSQAATFEKVVWVDDDGVQAASLKVSSYKTINEAIAKVAVNGVVNVLPGTYGPAYINKSLKLLAKNAKGNDVNPSNNPMSTEWPVIIQNAKNDGILSGEAVSNVSIRGFYIRDVAANGIHVMGDIMGTSNIVPLPIKSLCENMRIYLNKIENTGMDGIKAHQCNNVRIAGNHITNTSYKKIKLGKGDLEQAIDFVAVGNSIISNNYIGQSGTGMTAKAGSVNITVENNNFAGPFLWTAIAGEPSIDRYYFWSGVNSVYPYQLKNFLVKNNQFGPKGKYSDVSIRGCQNCSFIDNKMNNSFNVAFDSHEISRNICITNKHQTSFAIKSNAKEPLQFTGCKSSFKSAIKRQTISGWDIVSAN